MQRFGVRLEIIPGDDDAAFTIRYHFPIIAGGNGSLIPHNFAISSYPLNINGEGREYAGLLILAWEDDPPAQAIIAPPAPSVTIVKSVCVKMKGSAISLVFVINKPPFCKEHYLVNLHAGRGYLYCFARR